MTKNDSEDSKDLIYLVDDDPSFLTSLSQALQIEGYTILSFESVKAFLEADLLDDAVVISDMRMPELTGLDLQSALKERGLTIPMIFISGESTVNQAVSALKGGALDFLTKPFEPKDLLRLVEKAFASRRRSKPDKDVLSVLAPRERIAFQYFIQGFGNAYVAKKMAIQVSTVKEYKTNIFKKLGVTSLSELIEKFKI